MNIILTLIALSTVVFLHELGHMVAAKWSGVGVLQFSIGFGPKCFSFRIGETLYVVRLLPFGGFVKLAGMDHQSDECDPQKDYYNKPIMNRFITISAGSLMNVLTGFVLFTLMAFFMGTSAPTPQIKEVMPSSPAAEAGIRAGDSLVAFNGQAVTNVTDVIKLIQKNTGQPVTLTLANDGINRQLTLIPEQHSQNPNPYIGVVFAVEKVSYSFVGSLQQGGVQTWESIKMVFETLRMLINGRVQVTDFAGPVGIVQLVSQGLSYHLGYFFGLIAMISINLGVVNLFPFPVLDGGHLVILFLEKIRGKRLDQKVEIAINNIGAAVLIGMMCFILINDISSWGDRVEMFKELGK